MAVFCVLVLLGKVLELRAREKTPGAIRALLDLAPKTAVRVTPSGSDEVVQIDAIVVGELLRVRPGERVPVDGVGKGAQNGVLIRDAEALERMEKVDTLVVDKTGPLTEGRPRVTEVQTTSGYEAGAVLQKLASVERASEHLLAAAIVADALEKKLQLSPAEDFDSPVGKGVVGKVDGTRVVSGSAKFLAENGIAALSGQAESVRAKAATVIFVGLD